MLIKKVAQSLLISNVIICAQNGLSLEHKPEVERATDMIPRFNSALSRLVDVSNILPVCCLLHYTPYFIVNRVKVRTVRGP